MDKEIVEIEGSFVSVGDILKLKIKYGNRDLVSGSYKLVSNVNNISKYNDEFITVSLNSPLGKAIYQKKIGETVIGAGFIIMIEDKKIVE